MPGGRQPTQGFPSRGGDDLTSRIEELEKLLGELTIGHPTDPDDPTSGTEPTGAGTTHNGTLGNIINRWFYYEADTAGDLASQATCTHNLDLPFVSASTPNVTWAVLRQQRVGSATSGWMDVQYQGGTVTRDSIQLVFNSSFTPSGSNPLRWWLVFYPAVR